MRIWNWEMAIKEGGARMEIYLKDRFSDQLDIGDEERDIPINLFCSGCSNKIPETGWLNIYFSQFWMPKYLRSRC